MDKLRVGVIGGTGGFGSLRMKTFQEEGLMLVVKGSTSLPELMRVLKQ